MKASFHRVHGITKNIFAHNQVCCMRRLKEKQIETLKLYREGKKPREIEETTGYTSVEDAIKRGVKNIDKALETLQIAVDNNLMTTEQRIRAKDLLSKL